MGGASTAASEDGRLGLFVDPGLTVGGFLRGDDGEYLAAEADGRVLVGDRISRFNGEALAGLSLEAATERMRPAASHNVLGLQAANTADRVINNANDFSVILNGARPLGLRLSLALEVLDFVRPVVDGEQRASQAAETSISIGDRIVGVDGYSLLSASLRVRRAVMEAAFQPAPTPLAKATAHTVPFLGGLFGGPFSCRPRPIVRAVPETACSFSELKNAEALRGAIAVVARGECFFVRKAAAVADAGAVALVVVNNDGSPLLRMPAPGPELGGDAGSLPALPAAMVGHKEGQWLLDHAGTTLRGRALAVFGSALAVGCDVCVVDDGEVVEAAAAPAGIAVLDSRTSVAAAVAEPGDEKDGVDLDADDAAAAEATAPGAMESGGSEAAFSEFFPVLRAASGFEPAADVPEDHADSWS